MNDCLTGLPNIVAMLDWIKSAAPQAVTFPVSLLVVQLTALWQVNRTSGRAAGDELLCWFANTFRANHPGPFFRAGGDKFVVFLSGSDCCANNLNARLLAMAVSPANLDPGLQPLRAAVIHFTSQDQFTPGNVMACLFIALSDHYYSGGNPPLLEFHAAAIREMEEYPWMMIDLANQIMHIGSVADASFHEALTDSVSQLPNQRAAILECETALALAREKAEPLSILMIDGDNLRQFNTISYQAGDEAICLIGAALHQQLREMDFLARYRTGDEFLIVLRNTPRETALDVAQRLCWAVERASQEWRFHTTISIGAALYPRDGKTVPDLLEAAECRLEAAKRQGKNRVVICESNKDICV